MYCKGVYEFMHACVHISRCVWVERETGMGIVRENANFCGEKKGGGGQFGVVVFSFQIDSHAYRIQALVVLCEQVCLDV